MDIQRKQKNKSLKYFGYGLAFLLAIIAVWLLMSYHPVESQKINRDQVFVAQVMEDDFVDYISIEGNVVPITTIYLDAYEGGRVVEKYKEEGTFVKKGDVILKLENNNLYEQILLSESNLALKQNDLRSTKLSFQSRIVESNKELVNSQFAVQRNKRQYEQFKALHQDELISREEFNRAEEDFEKAKQQLEIVRIQHENNLRLQKTTVKELDSDLQRMQSTLQMIYNKLDHLNVRASADGQLGFLDAEVGQNISKGERVGQINILSDYKIEANIDEHYIDRVNQGLEAGITRSDKEFTLKLRKVYPEVRNGKFKVEFVFLNEKPETVRNGQSYNLNLKLGESEVGLLVPKGNFFNITGGQWIYVLDAEQENAYKRPISIGKQNPKYYRVLSGLSKGEQVIISGYDSFGDAEKIILQ